MQSAKRQRKNCTRLQAKRTPSHHLIPMASCLNNNYPGSITKITTHFPSILSAEESDDLQRIQYSEAAAAAAAVFRRRRRKQNKPQTTNGWNVSAEPEIQEMRSAEAAGFCFLLLLAWTRSPSSFVSIVGDR
jgi:hypothetical protein